MRSLHAKLMFGTTAVTVLLVGVGSIALYLLVRSALFAELDRSLGARVQSLASLVERDGNSIEIDFDKDSVQTSDAFKRQEYFQLWQADGTVLARSQQLQGGNLEHIDAPFGEIVFHFLALSNGERARAGGISFFPSRETDTGATRQGLSSGSSVEEPLTLVVAHSTNSLESTLARIGGLLLGVSLGTIALIPMALALVLRSALKPVHRLSLAIDEIQETELANRFETTGLPAELTPVVERLNRLMDRLEAAFAREKTFTADAAHELRTPLAGLRATLELALRQKREEDDYRDAMETCLSISKQMQSLIETLLSLARLDGPSYTARWSDVLVERSLRESWQLLDARSNERRLKVQWDVDPELQVTTDESRLRVILQNVLENAVIHVNDGGHVHVEAARKSGFTEVRVTNSGCHIDAGEVNRVFDRFWRADGARSSSGLHVGLGLALCKKLAESLDCEIVADVLPVGMFSLTLRFRESEAVHSLPRESTSA